MVHAPQPQPQPRYDVPGSAAAEQGIVLLEGPGGIAVALSPDAAEATARSLVAAAEEARRQARDLIR